MPAPLRPISATRSPGSMRRSSPRRIAGPFSISCQTPRSCERGRRRAAEAPPRARGSLRLARFRRVGGETGSRERPPRLLHRGGQRLEPRQREQPRRGRGQRRARLSRPGQELARVAVADHAAAIERDGAVGGGQAAFQAVLGDHDRGAPLLVEPPQEPDQLVARHRVELRGGLVEQQQLRPVGQRPRQRDPLQLATGERVGAAVEQLRDAERQRRLLHRPRDGRGRLAAVLERERDLRAHPAHHHLRLRVLEQRAADARELAGPVLAHGHARHDQLA